jgi:hypothetical protein
MNLEAILNGEDVLFTRQINETSTFSLDLDGIFGTVILHGLIITGQQIHTDDMPGAVKLTYSDNSIGIYKLFVGESLWWGDKFIIYSEPFASDTRSRETLWSSLRLYPREAAFDIDGYYLALMPDSKTIKNITVEFEICGAFKVSDIYITNKTPDVLAEYALPEGDCDAEHRKTALYNLEDITLSTKRNFPNSFNCELPKNYIGPVFRFTGDKYAEFFTNAIHYNIDDSAKKIDADGYSHTSTLGAPWYGYDYACGAYNPEGRIYPDQKPGFYYAECWTRDLGRTVSELIRLGRGEHAMACADWIFGMIRHWEDADAPLLRGKYKLPRHVQRILQRYETEVGCGCFENDGQALVTLLVWEIWHRLPGGAEWAKSHTDDIRALGDWYVWQFEHPELSGATDILWSDSESSGWPFRTGASLYVEVSSCEALLACAEIMRGINCSSDAERFEGLAMKMKTAIIANYTGKTPYGITWCKNEAWSGQTNVAHIILSCDRGHMDIYRNDTDFAELNRVAALRNARKYDGNVGGGMGYCQAYTLQSALLSDDMASVERMLQDTAHMIWHPVTLPYIVPENVNLTHDGAYVRIGDLGNSVQQSEIVKALRIIVGISDNGGLEFTPRIPSSWDGVSAENYPVLHHGRLINISYKYKIENGQEKFSLDFPEPAEDFTVRIKGERSCELIMGTKGKPQINIINQGGNNFTFASIPGGGKNYEIIFS